MPQTYKKLALHNSVCNEVFFKLQDCENEHPATRFIDVCTKFQKDLERCIKDNRERMRIKNQELAKERRERMKNVDTSNI